MDMVRSTGPDSFFGFSTFGDKNITGQDAEGHKRSLGYDTDYCYHVDVPLDSPNKDEIVSLFKEYTARAQGGGGDLPENVFGALYRAVHAPGLRWRESTPERATQKVIVLVTDSVSHIMGDVRSLTGHTVKDFGNG